MQELLNVPHFKLKKKKKDGKQNERNSPDTKRNIQKKIKIERKILHTPMRLINQP